MTNKIRYLIFLLLLTLFVGCSFHKSKIWSGDEKEKQRIAELEYEQKRIIEVVQIHTSEKNYSKEIHATKNAILTTPKKNVSWPMAGLNIQNSVGNIYLSNISNNFLNKKIGKNKFSVSTIISSPLIFDDNIIFSDDTGTIFNVSKRGRLKWKKNIYKKIYKKIYKNLTYVIHKNKIYVADNIGFIYAMNLENGELFWIKNHGVPIKSNIKIYEGNLYLINQDNRLLCFNLEKGSKVWDLRTIKSFIKSQSYLALAISEQGHVIALNSSGNLLKLNPYNGSVYWSLNIKALMGMHDTDFFKSSDIIIVKNDIIFSTSSSIFSYNLETGYLNWQKELGSSNNPIVDGSNLFTITDNGYFINFNRKDGKIIWSTNILKVLKKKKQKTSITGFVMGSGKIYATSYNGYLIVCSAVSGKVEYFKKIGGIITASPVISNSSLFILTDKPRLLGFN